MHGKPLHDILPAHSTLDATAAGEAWLRSHPDVRALHEDTQVYLPEPRDESRVTLQFPGEAPITVRATPGERARAASARQGQSSAPAGHGRPRRLATRGLPPSQLLWNLDRIDMRDLPLDNSYEYTQTGADVDVYVVDTGIRVTHEQFEDRAVLGFNGIADGRNTDCDGHGSHVAGTIGGKDTGIASQASLIGVRVFPCAGQGGASTRVLLEALQWVSTTAAARKPRRGVVNLSLGAGRNTPLNSAVNALNAQGLAVVVAAGNENQDAANVSPASASDVMAVGATDIEDQKASFSNFGSTVDIQAPGVDILSAWWTTDTAYNVISGTSMASPLVAGLAARVLAKFPAATPAQVRAALVCAGSTGKITGLPNDGTPNIFSYLPAAGATEPGTDGQCAGNRAPDSLCPNNCTGRGTCQADGTCKCQCGFVGAACENAIPVQQLTGQAGAVRGQTEGKPSLLGTTGGEQYYQLEVPPGATRLSLTTCDTATDHDTVVWALNRCFDKAITRDQLIAVNDDGEAGTCKLQLTPRADRYTPATFPEPSLIDLPNPAPGTYYIMVEGFDDQNVGTYGLRWSITGGAAPSASPLPKSAISFTPLPPDLGKQPAGPGEDPSGDWRVSPSPVPQNAGASDGSASAGAAVPAALLVAAAAALAAGGLPR